MSCDSCANSSAASPSPYALKYHDLVMSGLDAIERELAQTAVSAEAAAEFFDRDGHQIGICGDHGAICEAAGRSGGFIRLSGRHELRDPNWKGVVMFFPRDDRLDADLDRAAELHARACLIMVFGRSSVLRAVRERLGSSASNVWYTDIHSSQHGGLFQAADGRWVVPTDPALAAAALWVWTGEFIAACTRRGKMPPMYQSYALDTKQLRPKKYGHLKFHAEPAAQAVPAGQIAREFLNETRRELLAVRTHEMGKIAEAAALAHATLSAGRRGYRLVHNHSIMGHLHCPHDPGYLPAINKSWHAMREDLPLSAGDFILCAGYAFIYSGGHFGDLTHRLRKMGVRQAWTMTDYDRNPDTGVPAIAPDEPFVNQHWALGDAVATVPGYDIKILPTSGVLSEAALWMINAEIFRLQDGKVPPPVAMHHPQMV